MAITNDITTLNDASDAIITVGNQVYNVMNGAANETVSTDSGDIPTIRYAITHNLYFLDPEDWSAGDTETIFNQLRAYTDGDGYVTLYFAPSATSSNPVTMGVTPEGDDNWKPSPYHMATDSQALAGSGDNPISATQLKLAEDQFGNFGSTPEYADDLDDLDISGDFITTDETTNKPSDDYNFSVHSAVSVSDSSQRSQTAVAIDDIYLYIRYLNNDSDGWSDWNNITPTNTRGYIEIGNYISTNVVISDNVGALFVDPHITSTGSLKIPEDSIAIVLK